MATSKASQQPKRNSLALILLGVAIIAVLFAFISSLVADDDAPSGSSSAPVTQVADNAIDSQGRITLAGVYGVDGPTLIKLLEDNGYSYSASDGYWTKEGSGYLYEFALFDEDGELISQTMLGTVKGQVDDVYEIGLYSQTARDEDYGLSSHRVDIAKQQTMQAANQQATVAIVSGGGEKHLVLVNLDLFDSYEYEVYSASGTMIKNTGTNGLNARSLDSAYNEAISNYR